MSEADHFRRKADELLREASRAENMNARGRLIDEAMRWHQLAMDATGHGDMRVHNNDDAEGSDVEEPDPPAARGGGAHAS